MSAREDPLSKEPHASVPVYEKGKGKQPAQDSQPQGESSGSATIHVDAGQSNSQQADGSATPRRPQRRPTNKNQ